MNELRFEIKPFEELDIWELYRIVHLRDIVFVVGQKITAVSEVDGEDPRCAHAMLYDGERLVGTARVFHREDPMIVGRVAVLTEEQGRGLGTVLMKHVQDWLGSASAELHAQAHLEEWYTRLGWERFGEVFYEAEIPHVMMRWG